MYLYAVVDDNSDVKLVYADSVEDALSKAGVEKPSNPLERYAYEYEVFRVFAESVKGPGVWFHPDD